MDLFGETHIVIRVIRGDKVIRRVIRGDKVIRVIRVIRMIRVILFKG